MSVSAEVRSSIRKLTRRSYRRWRRSWTTKRASAIVFIMGVKYMGYGGYSINHCMFADTNVLAGILPYRND